MFAIGVEIKHVCLIVASILKHCIHTAQGGFNSKILIHIHANDFGGARVKLDISNNLGGGAKAIIIQIQISLIIQNSQHEIIFKQCAIHVCPSGCLHGNIFKGSL